MQEHPIIFSGEMVRAILEGRKTQTRRPLRIQPLDILPMKVPNEWVCMDYRDAEGQGHGHVFKCRFGIPGDRLWVRETWGKCVFPETETSLSRIKILYRADGETQYDIGRWKPSIHMPRWASRITLEIVNVRVERLQKITKKDAYAEGVQVVRVNVPAPGFRIGDPLENPIDVFHFIWDQLNSKRGFGWESNCWCWVLTFKRIEPPMT